jgi:hypothetical protein
MALGILLPEQDDHDHGEEDREVASPAEAATAPPKRLNGRQESQRRMSLSRRSAERTREFRREAENLAVQALREDTSLVLFHTELEKAEGRLRRGRGRCSDDAATTRPTVKAAAQAIAVAIEPIDNNLNSNRIVLSKENIGAFSFATLPPCPIHRIRGWRRRRR